MSGTPPDTGATIEQYRPRMPTVLGSGARGVLPLLSPPLVVWHQCSGCRAVLHLPPGISSGHDGDGRASGGGAADRRAGAALVRGHGDATASSSYPPRVAAEPGVWCSAWSSGSLGPACAEARDPRLPPISGRDPLDRRHVQAASGDATMSTQPSRRPVRRPRRAGGQRPAASSRRAGQAEHVCCDQRGRPRAPARPSPRAGGRGGTTKKASGT